MFATNNFISNLLVTRSSHHTSSTMFPLSSGHASAIVNLPNPGQTLAEVREGAYRTTPKAPPPYSPLVQRRPVLFYVYQESVIRFLLVASCRANRV